MKATPAKKPQTVYVSDEAHAAAKLFCKDNALKLGAWVSKLILREIKEQTSSEELTLPQGARVQ